MAVILSMQDQLSQLNANMERLIEQIADANKKRYGRSSEKLDVIAGQLELELIFNEAEALTETLYVVEPAEEDVIQVNRRKRKGKREEDLKDLPVEVIPHTLSDEKLQEHSSVLMAGRGFRMKFIKESASSRLCTPSKSIMWLSMPAGTIRRSLRLTVRKICCGTAS